MKKSIILLVLAIISIIAVNAQPTQAFKYQAVVRDNAGEIISNQAIGIQISIRDAIPNGTIVYQETFSETTNQFGLVNLEIGTGTPTIGTFTGIDWGSNSKFLEVEIDPAGGSSYVSMGTSELLSVPYALFSDRSSDVVWNKNGNKIYYNNGNVGIGTDNPSDVLHVYGSGVFRANSGGLGIAPGTDYGSLLYTSGSGSYSNMRLYWAKTEFNGDVGIGTASPVVPLHVYTGTDIELDDGGYFIIGSTASSNIGMDNNEIMARSNGSASHLYLNYEGGDVSIGGSGSGNLGIGTTSPATKLVVKSSGYTDGMYVLADDNDRIFRIRQMSGGGGGIYAYDDSDNSTVLLNGEGSSWIMSGYVGIGTSTPNADLHVDDCIRVGEDPTYGNVYGELIHEGGGNGFKINANANGGWADMHLQTDGNTRMFIESGGNVGIGTTSPASRLDVRGNVTIRDNSTGHVAVELGTGLDYSEGFNVSDKTNIEPGTVLCIDQENSGNLKISSEPYDFKVAGIVAGANNLGSGIILGTGIHDFNVALAGRVYCNVDASFESVEVGDLLTTSSLPGYAMKVIDKNKAQGAILGKAMESLEKGQKGQILVLVTLQ